MMLLLGHFCGGAFLRPRCIGPLLIGAGEAADGDRCSWDGDQHSWNLLVALASAANLGSICHHLGNQGEENVVVGREIHVVDLLEVLAHLEHGEFFDANREEERAKSHLDLVVSGKLTRLSRSHGW